MTHNTNNTWWEFLLLTELYPKNSSKNTKVTSKAIKCKSSSHSARQRCGTEADRVDGWIDREQEVQLTTSGAENVGLVERLRAGAESFPVVDQLFLK